MSETLNKNIPAFDYINKTLVFCQALSSGVSLFSVTTLIGMPVGIASVSKVYCFLWVIVKMVLKIMEKTKYRKIASLAKSKNWIIWKK